MYETIKTKISCSTNRNLSSKKLLSNLKFLIRTKQVSDKITLVFDLCDFVET